MEEAIGIVIFSAFMAIVVVALVANVLLALYRERRRKAGESHGGPADE
jgi:hypothetical protein